MADRDRVTCSAPGKILLAGGYLVLDPAYSGLVLALSARIYSTISPHRRSRPATIEVNSPQFPGAVWTYTAAEGAVVEGDGKNAFVREALETCLAYFCVGESDFDVSILADNQYYTIPAKKGTKFSISDKSISDTPKTGLGSSAALVTSLCAALYIYLSRRTSASTLTDDDLCKIHNLAQIAHSRAQGKVGSGFDIASAVYGSCLYSRFPANLIDGLSREFRSSDSLQSVVDSQWPMTTQKVQLRAGLRLLMGDVSKGSSTPGMVKKVKSCAAAMDIWPSLGISNDLLSDFLTSTAAYSAAEENNIRDVSRSVRGLLKQMGNESDVEIEPDSQTAILDKTLIIPGVVACGVPGAGGYDAIYAIVEDRAAVIDSVCELWQDENVKTLDLTDDGQGVQLDSGFDVEVALKSRETGTEERST